MDDYHQLLQQQLAAGLQRMQLDIAETDQQKLVRYLTTLHKWNKTHNLTAIRDPQLMVGRHLLDSLSVAQYIKGQSLLDVGSGAGLPGIPLAIVKPHLNVTLIDSVQKKTRFMLFAASESGLGNVVVEHGRVESFSNQAGYDTIVARAFSSIEKLCTLTEHLLAPRGQILAMIGKPLDHEASTEKTGNEPAAKQIQLGSGTQFRVISSEKLFVPGETAQRNIVILQKSV